MGLLGSERGYTQGEEEEDGAGLGKERTGRGQGQEQGKATALGHYKGKALRLRTAS